MSHERSERMTEGSGVPCDDAAVERATRAMRAIFLIATDEQAQIAAEAVLRAAGETQTCQLPPAGWSCSREGGHAGPCAATAMHEANSYSHRLPPRLRAEIARRGWTQAQVGEQLGRTQATVSYWCGGKREPSLDDLLALADLFDVPVDYLLGRRGYVR